MMNLWGLKTLFQNPSSPFKAREMKDSQMTNFDFTEDFGATSVVAAVARFLLAIAFANIEVKA